MPHADFVHLTVHTAYSLSEGAIRIKAAKEKEEGSDKEVVVAAGLVDFCRRGLMPAVAITDTNNLFGALEFSQAMAGAGIQPIIGCRLSVARKEAPSNAFNVGKALKKPEPDAIILLAQNQAGYRNLMKLSSLAYLESPPGETAQVPWSAVAAHAEGLLALTAGPDGALGRLLAAVACREGDGADRCAGLLADMTEHQTAVVCVRDRSGGLVTVVVVHPQPQSAAPSPRTFCVGVGVPDTHQWNGRYTSQDVADKLRQLLLRGAQGGMDKYPRAPTTNIDHRLVPAVIRLLGGGLKDNRVLDAAVAYYTSGPAGKEVVKP